MKHSHLQFIPSLCVICHEPTLFDSPADHYACCSSCGYVILFGDRLRAFPLSEWRRVAEAQSIPYGRGVA